MKTFNLNTQILIICWALIADGASTPQKHIGSDGREYLIEYNNKYDWFEAWQECARLNRQLLTIVSAEKQNGINVILDGLDFKTILWLGANDGFNPRGNADRPFFWSATGKQFTYTNWKHQHGPKIGGFENCVLIVSGNNEWTNWICQAKRGFICEEKQLLESYNKNSNNTSDVVQQFLIILKDNMAQLNGRLENIKQAGNNTNYEVEQLTNIIQTAVEKILNKQEISTKELNHEITKQGSDLSDQLKRTADEMNTKFSDKQNFTYPPIVLIKQTG